LNIKKLGWAEALERGLKLLHAGKPEESIPYFRQSMKANPDEPGTANAYQAAKEGLAQALKKLGRHGEAERLMRPPGWREFRLDEIRGALLVLLIILGPIAFIWYGAPHALKLLAPAEDLPTALFTMRRGESKEVFVSFLHDIDIKASGARATPATAQEINGAWEGYENRGHGVMETSAGRIQGREVAMPGQAVGLVWGIGAGEIAGKTGGVRIYLSADDNLKPGKYRIWLAGAYLDHEKRKSAERIGYPSDPADQVVVADPFWPNETIPMDRARIPLVEVIVE